MLRNWSIFGLRQGQSVIFLVLVIVTLLIGTAEIRAETIHLTEKKVIELALEKNLGVKIALTDSEIGETGVQGAKSIFDTLLEFNVDHFIDQRDTSITVFGTDNRTTNFNLGVSKVLPSGTRSQLQWRNQRSSTDSAFATLNPFYESALEFSIVQPLLNNMFGKQDRGAVTVAKKAFDTTDYLTQRRIREATFGVLFQYWRWMTNKAVVSVSQRSVREARKFEDISRQKEEFGLHESTDVLASKSNRLNMENIRLRAQQRRDDSLGRLKRGLNLPDEILLESKEKVPFSKDLTGHDHALATAFENRTDFLAAKSNVESRNIELSLAKNRKWPELDLVASLAINGVAGGYGDTLSELGSADNPSFFIGGEFRYPIENRFARSEARKADLEKAKALYQLKDLENLVRQDVEERWREVSTSIKLVLQNRRIERLEADKWKEELKKYRTGRSSSDIVVRFQEDYLTAQRITLNSLFNYRMAVLGLQLAQNTLIP